jgi:hypothetical protein
MVDKILSDAQYPQTKCTCSPRPLHASRVRDKPPTS